MAYFISHSDRQVVIYAFLERSFARPNARHAYTLGTQVSYSNIEVLLIACIDEDYSRLMLSSVILFRKYNG